MGYPDTFHGYAVFDKENWKDLKPFEYKPKDFQDHDIDIKIEYCGVCGSDIHTLRSGWGPTIYPVVVGHEIVGKAVKVGPKVQGIKVGDLVGVGACSCSCMKCKDCNDDNEQYCRNVIDTYNSRYPEGWKSYGGYADYARVHEKFVFPIPSEIPPDVAAPMMCAGLTLFSPLKRAGVKKGTKVGIVGIGGLGHFGVMFASALGAEVTAISHSNRKEQDAYKMGASHFISTANDPNWMSNPDNIRSLDVIMTTNFSLDAPIEGYLNLLSVGGTLVLIGIPEGNLPPLNAMTLMTGNYALRGTNVGSKAEALEMFKLAVDKNIRTWIQEMPMSKCKEAVELMDQGKAHYRFVLKADFDKEKL